MGPPAVCFRSTIKFHSTNSDRRAQKFKMPSPSLVSCVNFTAADTRLSKIWRNQTPANSLSRAHKIDLPPIQTCTTMSPSNTSNNSSDRAIIIFDWDDTILPSSFVDRVKADNLQELPQQYHNLFREIEQCTEKCLAAAAKHGEVSYFLCC